TYRLISSRGSLVGYQLSCPLQFVSPASCLVGPSPPVPTAPHSATTNPERKKHTAPSSPPTCTRPNSFVLTLYDLAPGEMTQSGLALSRRFQDPGSGKIMSRISTYLDHPLMIPLELDASVPSGVMF